MDEEVLVYHDRFKQSSLLAATMIFLAGCGYILFREDTHILAKIFVTVLGILLLIQGLTTIKAMAAHDLCFKFDEHGVTDYTKKRNVLFLSWDEIVKIEMVSNNTSLQIGILAGKTIEDAAVMNDAIKENMTSNGNLIYYNVIIDGFGYRKKKFAQIFHDCIALAKKYNPKIYIQEYQDPFTKQKS